MVRGRGDRNASRSSGFEPDATRRVAAQQLAISDRMKSRLVVNALASAVARRGDVAGCIVPFLTLLGTAFVWYFSEKSNAEE